MWGEDASEVCRNNQMSWTSIGPTALQTCGTATQHWPWRLLPRRLLGRQCAVVVVAVAVAVVVVVVAAAAAAATCCWVCGCFWSLPNIPRKKCAAGFELQGLSSSEPVISPRQGFSCVIGVPVYGRLQAACVPPHGVAARRLLASCRPAATAIAR